MIRNRFTFQVLIALITFLSAYQIYFGYKQLQLANFQGITHQAYIYFFFTISITITGCISYVYNGKLSRYVPPLTSSNLLDDIGSNKGVKLGSLYYVYLVFSLLLVSAAIFFTILLYIDNPPINTIPYYVIFSIVFCLGLIFLRDVIKIKRIRSYNESDQNQR